MYLILQNGYIDKKLFVLKSNKFATNFTPKSKPPGAVTNPTPNFSSKNVGFMCNWPFAEYVFPGSRP